jgi:hypothetical protein
VLPRRELRDELRRARRVAVALGQLGEQLMRQPAPAKHRGPRRADDLLDRGVLRHEADRARPDGVHRRGQVSVGGQHHHHRREWQRGHLPGEVDPAGRTEAHVHDHRLRPPRRRDAECLAGIADGQRLEVRLGGEDRLKALAEDAVIVDDEEVLPHHPLRASGARCRSRPLHMSTIPSRTA